MIIGVLRGRDGDDCPDPRALQPGESFPGFVEKAAKYAAGDLPGCLALRRRGVRVDSRGAEVGLDRLKELVAPAQQRRFLAAPENAEDFPPAGQPGGATVVKAGGDQAGHPFGHEVVLGVHGNPNGLDRHISCAEVPRVSIDVGDAGIRGAEVNTKIEGRGFHGWC